METPPRGKVVRLSEIKTNSQRRRRKQIAEDIGSLKGAVHDLDVVGYTVVLFKRDGNQVCFWDTAELGVQGTIRGELSKRALDRQAAMNDVEQALYGDDE